jgi:hypothetical protein
MTEAQLCDNCHEELEKDPVRRGDKVYCCEACAFEASRSVDCGGRSDSNVAQSNVEKA